MELSFTLPAGTKEAVVLQSIDGGYSWTEAVTAESLTADSTSAVVTGLGGTDGFEDYYTNGIFYQFRLAVTQDDESPAFLSNTVQYYYHD